MNTESLRSLFPVTRRWTFLDHAAVAPLPEPAAQAVSEYAADLAANGIAAFRTWDDRIKQARDLAARLLSADPLDVAFVKNTSEGIGLVAEGFPWRAGDNVVIAEEEYPSNQYPWMNLARKGVEVRRVPSRGSRVEVDDVRAALDARTRVVSLSFVGFASGFRNDLTTVGTLCRERNVRFFVDAIQGLGVLPLDVTKLPVDYLAADSHKWLLGPEGAGLFWARREALAELEPVGVGWNSVVKAWDFGTIDFTLKPHAGRYESGAYNVAGIAGMGASLKVLLDVGVAEVAARVKQLTDYACEQARRGGLTVFSSRAGDDWSGIVSLEVPGDPAAVMKRCREAGIVVNSRAGRVRVSPHAYNTFDELDYAVGEISEG